MESIIKKVQEGDENAFKQLCISFENDLYRVAKARLKDDDDIKDAIQNTMLITFQNSKKIKNIECFKTWIIHVLINECNKIYNLYKKQNELFRKVTISTNFNSFDNSIQDIQDKMSFDFIIDKLNYDEKLVITLYYNSQFSCTQIAKILNSNVNTVKSRLKRGKEKIKKFYEEDDVYAIK